MQTQLASGFQYFRTLVLLVALAVSCVFVLAVITDESGDTGCGGG
jgi:hypothetical protein